MDASLTMSERLLIRAYALGHLQGRAARDAQRLLDSHPAAHVELRATRDDLVEAVERAGDGVVPAGALDALLARVRRAED